MSTTSNALNTRQERVLAVALELFGRYVGSMLASDIGNLLHNQAMQLEDIVDPASAAFDDRLSAAIAAALSENDRSRLGVTPEQIAGAVHTVAQGAKYLSNARGESREEFVARMTAAVHVVFAGFGATAKRAP